MIAAENEYTILLVDDEEQILLGTSLMLRNGGISHVETIQDSREVLPFLSQHKVTVIILDLFMPYVRGQELIEIIAREYPHIPMIVMTASDKLETAVACMKTGAFDYLVKPVDKNRLISCLKKALEVTSLREEVSSLREHLLCDKIKNGAAFSQIVTVSKKMRAIFHYMEVIAPTNQPILIYGETGTGKELIARALHTLSGCTGNFVAVNSAGLDDHMFSDALFGHRKGSFTGADHERAGFIGTADRGTLFLDEIGDLHETSQIKLLRLLQEQEYYQVGSDIPKQSKARIVAATNRNPKELVTAGDLRSDLYFRLCTHQIDLPPLRERFEDLPLLVDHFLAKASNMFHKEKPKYPYELISLLSAYHFPGNIRELESIIFDAVARHNSGVLSVKNLKHRVDQKAWEGNKAEDQTYTGSGVVLSHDGCFPTLKQAENLLISEAMRRTGNHQRIAASLLGISRQALNKRLHNK